MGDHILNEGVGPGGAGQVGNHHQGAGGGGESLLYAQEQLVVGVGLDGRPGRPGGLPGRGVLGVQEGVEGEQGVQVGGPCLADSEGHSLYPLR